MKIMLVTKVSPHGIFIPLNVATSRGTILPIVLDGDTVIQGSGAIIDWADEQAQDHARRLTLATH